MSEIELILTSILNCQRTDLYSQRHTLKLEQLDCLSNLLYQRKKGMSLQYLLGKTEFMGMQFLVNEDVFIPRPETEILVETVINIAKLLNCHTVELLDIGTGSGSIAISLAKYLPPVKITAIDISEKAIEVAKQNARLNNVEVSFLKSDLFSSFKLQASSFKLIVSNPPYIPQAEIDNLQPEVKKEPRIALDGGEDGLDFYRRIIKDAQAYLKKEGFLIMEIGYNQAKAIEEIVRESDSFKLREIIKDYSGIERVVVLRKNG